MLDDSTLYATFSRLVRVQTALWNTVDARLREQHGFPLTHVTALQVVATTPDCRVHELVSILHITVGGASKVVDRLVAAGHVVREANPNDRRSSILRVTDAGSMLLASVAPDVELVLGERFAGPLASGDLAELDRLLGFLQVEESAR
jgi:DNA-binding MarR family transcriptional regulator